MSEQDRHIHVDAKALRDTAATRNILASAFALAGDLPSTVTTGCGLRVPYAMTSSRPERVTCLPCREHAAREHLRLAEEIERLGAMAGSTIPRNQAADAAASLRDLARRFWDT
ncbi:hypothetical protein [Streptomyces blattellae]|uniref:hypothetical protein n=1 Tax=Streptomyces blattellae TaxID=2569855 RepID=UPI0012B9C5F4|nr:hypothetical protein [Streptomyces blattellae]